MVAPRSLYLTADKVGTVSGGGIVTRKESEALGEGTVILDREAVDPGCLDKDDPFVFDRLALAKVKAVLNREPGIRLAHVYAGTFGETVKFLRAAGVRVAYTCAAHDRKASIEEFERNGQPYPFKHISDDAIFARYAEGYLAADVVIVPSKHSAEVVKGYGCKNVRIIPHGVDLPEKVASMPKRFTVGYFGAIGWDKGLRYLLEAWRILGYEDATLLIGGSESEGAVSLIRSFGGGNIRIVGRVEELADFYDQVSVYVQPSVTEGFGLEILEAMVHGRSVICSEGAGGVDVVGEGVSGFKVQARSAQDIVHVIQWFRDRPHEVTKMGQRARDASWAFAWDVIQAKYMDVWNKLLGVGVYS